MAQGPRVVVIGAGAFGGWSALELQRAGADVRLFDAWGPGNARSSSGGESRVIRAIYGRERLYTGWAARALVRWREFDRERGTGLYRRTGVLWLCGDDVRYVEASRPLLREYGLDVERLEPAEVARRFSAVDPAGLACGYYEAEGGRLLARAACREVVRALEAVGGSFEVAEIVLEGGTAKKDGVRLEADVFVFACGPWLPSLFPEIAEHTRVSRQEIYYFGTPPGGVGEDTLPVWADTALGWYGIPATDHRGFKLADHGRGPPFDPSRDDRSPTPAGVEAAREFLARRFPALSGSPLLEARVCQYTNTPDEHLIVDTLPGREDVWLVGGGSGHGFKLGPALGEHVAGAVLGREPRKPEIGLARLAALRFAAGGTPFSGD